MNFNFPLASSVLDGVNSSNANRIRQTLQDVIISGRAQGMKFMDDAIFALLEQGIVSPYEAFMKAIDKNRFKDFLSPEEAHLGDAAGAVDERERPSSRVKRLADRQIRTPPKG